ncbi:MAG: sulfatase [Planctomycetes bacterium]|nr:sulfatase [Planctomycetota bacterium]
MITRRTFLKLAGLSAGVAMLPLGCWPPPRVRQGDPGGPPPNFVFVLVDDMGWRDIGCYGGRFFDTPNVDRLAAQGMRFTNGYAACPVCSPTRLSILTGHYPARVHLTNYLVGQRWPDNSPLRPVEWRHEMPPEEVTLAEILKTAGYATACIGKWHLDSKMPGTTPEAQGFDVVVGQVPNQTDKQASGLTDKAVEFIRTNKDKPFFLYLAHHSVHIPLEATPDLVEKYEKRVRPDDPRNNPTYGGMVECVDRSVGRLMAVLDELALTERTVFVFMSDNGGVSMKEGAKTPATSNLPLRAGKGHVYEGGIREPWIMRWPGVIRPGTTCDVPVSSVDYYPTFLEMAGVRAGPDQGLDGESLLPLLKQKGGLKRDAIFWHFPHYSNQGGVPAGAVRQGDLKLVEFYEDNHVELYNLKDDIGERHDLAAKMPAKAAGLQKSLDAWRTKYSHSELR